MPNKVPKGVGLVESDTIVVKSLTQKRLIGSKKRR
jgi:hypothetical protein